MVQWKNFLYNHKANQFHSAVTHCAFLSPFPLQKSPIHDFAFGRNMQLHFVQKCFTFLWVPIVPDVTFIMN
jgi:hypothetical protein